MQSFIDRFKSRLRYFNLSPIFPKLLFVTGAPRTGTTFISDWITESPEAYCAHEILREVENKNDRKIVKFLLKCAADGNDRLSKVHENSAMKWVKKPPKSDLKLLGFKEPFAWFTEPNKIPYAVGPFFEKHDSLYVVAARHPYDVIASGKHRALHTRNWPNYTTEQHCSLWRSAIALYRLYQAKRFKAVCIKWERLILDFDGVKQELEEFLQLDLPVFYGYEQTPEYIEELRKQSTLQEGAALNDKRRLLTDEDRSIVRRMTSDLCKEFDYIL